MFKKKWTNSVLALSIASGMLLAGCSGGDEKASTPKDSGGIQMNL